MDHFADLISLWCSSYKLHFVIRLPNVYLLPHPKYLQEDMCTDQISTEFTLRAEHFTHKYISMNTLQIRRTWLQGFHSRG